MTTEPVPTVTSCPACGSDEYVIRLRVSGTIEEAHSFTGQRIENTQMWDSVVLKPLKVLR